MKRQKRRFVKPDFNFVCIATDANRSLKTMKN